MRTINVISRVIFFALATVLFASPANAEQVDGNQVVLHKTQESSHRLFSEGDAHSKTSHRYRVTKHLRLPPGAGTFDGKPTCNESRIRREPVYFDSVELRDFDLKIYDYKDKTQIRRAKVSKTPTVPYIEGDRHNPKRKAIDLQQDFSRFFEIECLPTRIHFVTVGGKRYEEYREGDKAWE